MTQAVLFDFSGTLFHIESARAAVRAALDDTYLHLVPNLERLGAINGSGTPEELPDELADVWHRRDLSHDAHRAAYSGLAMHAGLTPDEARRLYDRGVQPDAWHPFADTLEALRHLRERRTPVALVSNIGWDPRPVLRRYGADRYLDTLILSDEIGVMKPDPAIFTAACDALGVEPSAALMVGDNGAVDGGATSIGARFTLVSSAPDRDPATLLRAVGLR